MESKGDTVRRIAEQVGQILDQIDRRDGYSAEIYGESCFMAGLEQLSRVMDQAEIVELLRMYADRKEAVLLHAQRLTGEILPIRPEGRWRR